MGQHRKTEMHNLHSKGKEENWVIFSFISVMTLLYIATCIETDMYVPAFPQMVKDLGTTEDQIQWVLGLNFIGLCFSSLWIGPLADCFGRRKIILWGMVLFVLASFGCIFCYTLPPLLFWRFLQGVGAGAPMTAGYAILLDRFEIKKALSLIGIMNTVITLVMAGAPILGAWITFHAHWRMNFIIIFILGTASLISFYLAIPETLPTENRSQFHLPRILNDYKTVMKNIKFLAYVHICTFIFGGIMVFISNQSLIFLNYLKVSGDVYGLYQASSMVSFALGSLITGLLVKQLSVLGVKRSCMALTFLGGVGLVVTALWAPQNVLLITLFMVIINFGAGLGLAALTSSALDPFPNMKATASGLMGFLRLLLTTAMVGAGARFFNGTILPVAIIIGGAQGLALLIYVLARKARRDNSHRAEEGTPLPVIH